MDSPPPHRAEKIKYSLENDKQNITVQQPGFIKCTPALKLLAIGIVFFAVGLFVIVAAAIGSLREFGIWSAVAFLIGASVGAGIAWLGYLAINWSLDAAWANSSIVLSKDKLTVTRSRPLRNQTIFLERKDFQSVTITDEFWVVDELLVTTKDHRVHRILNGRTQNELKWIANLILGFWQNHSKGNN